MLLEVDILLLYRVASCRDSRLTIAPTIYFSHTNIKQLRKIWKQKFTVKLELRVWKAHSDESQ